MNITVSVNLITIGLLNNSISLSSITLKDFRANRTIYPAMKEAKAKGYDAHHINPIMDQMENSGFKNRKEFLSKASNIDDRCLRYTHFEHIIDHFLMAKENNRYILMFEVMTRHNFIKLLENEKDIINQCKELAILRAEGRKKSNRNKYRKFLSFRL